jgi:CheY-like chemotaxis protein
MFGVASAVAQLAEDQLQAPDLSHDLVEGFARAVWIRLYESPRDLCVSADRREGLPELRDDPFIEIELGIDHAAFHRRAPAVARVSTTTRVSGSSALRMRAIAGPPHEGMSLSRSATSGLNQRTSSRACAPSSASPTTSKRGSLAKLARSARRNVASPSPMNRRRAELAERDAGRLRPLRSSGGVGEIGLVCTPRLFDRVRYATRSHLGTSAPRPASDVPERALVPWLLARIVVGVTKTRVLLAEDDPSVREKLRYLINAQRDLECVGVATNGRQCIDMCRELQPEVLVVDEILPGADGLAITAIVGSRLPQIRVVMYTFNPEVCKVARELGAVGCVPKYLPYEVLLGALRQAAPVPALRSH